MTWDCLIQPHSRPCLRLHLKPPVMDLSQELRKVPARGTSSQMVRGAPALPPL